MACQSADFHTSGSVVVVSGSDGKWVAINLKDQEILHEGSDGDEIIQVRVFASCE